jgi:hypothetical protein
LGKQSDCHPMTSTSRLRRMFSLDERSLALFRMGLGLLVMKDVIERSEFLNIHYTDDGVLPRSVVAGWLEVEGKFYFSYCCILASSSFFLSFLSLFC